MHPIIHKLQDDVVLMEGNTVLGIQGVKYWADFTPVWNARVGHYPGQCRLPIPNKLGAANQKIHEPVTEGWVHTGFRQFVSEYVGNDCIKWRAVVNKDRQ